MSNYHKTNEYWERQKSAQCLINQSMSLGARHIKNGDIRLRFTRDMRLLAESIVRNANAGKISHEDSIKALKKEQRSLLEQSTIIVQKGITAVAGFAQTVSGGGICWASAGTLCAFIGAPLMAHGVNNMYEGGRYFVDGSENTIGPVRFAYRQTSAALGYTDNEADIAYGSIDLGLSFYGLTSALKAPVNASISGVKQFKLFRYASDDYIKGYKTMSKSALRLEVLSNGLTIKSIKEAADAE
ncbi:DUF4225 domain-containing protein [Aliivibrio fischeri]|uniref:DUF4225 domain-containing protein n=1 Tax=Aliivibrio fischeri TaxID=668 RepID=UPI00084CD705|nr:DUF4225 domain-containing protein [Aliivibrio fischeri]OED52234.1 hypothetical protein BEI47_19325 [Aliivibrio fischeri]